MPAPNLTNPLCEYWTDFNGALTNKVWLYKARKKGYTISIYA